MKKENVLKVFTGTTITATAIKERLEEAGIKAFLEDDLFYQDVLNNSEKLPEKLDVYVAKQNLAEAQKVIEEAYIDVMK